MEGLNDLSVDAIIERLENAYDLKFKAWMDDLRANPDPAYIAKALNKLKAVEGLNRGFLSKLAEKRLHNLIAEANRIKIEHAKIERANAKKK